LLKEPYRTTVIVAQCLGLRVSEIATLQWQDFDFERQQLLVQRSIVNGQVDVVGPGNFVPVAMLVFD
jgi:integrase